MTDPRYHSVAAVVPFLIAATVLGIARLVRRRRTRAIGAVLLSSAVLALVVGAVAARGRGHAARRPRVASGRAHVDALR